MELPQTALHRAVCEGYSERQWQIVDPVLRTQAEL